MRALKAFVAASALLLTFNSAIANGVGGVEPEVALQELQAGNSRYISGNMTHPDQDSARREEVALGQHPSSVIVSCSDSRVPPEVVFDQGLGDLFTIRTAGEVVDNAALASIEYAVEHLGVKLIVVMGHQKCGAVKATVDGVTGAGHLHSLTSAIEPAVNSVRNLPGDLLDNAVHANIDLVAESLRQSNPILAEKIKTGELKVVGAYYSLDTGAVTFETLQ